MNVGKNAIKLSVGKALAQLMTLLSTMLLSRYLSLKDYGTYSQAIIIITIAIAVLMLGLPNCMNYFMGKACSDDERQAFLSSFYTISFIIGVIMGGILICFQSFIIWYYKNSDLKTIWWFFLLYPLASIVVSSSENLYIVYNKTSNLITFRAINSAVILSAIIISKIYNVSLEIYLLELLIITIIFAGIVYYRAYTFAKGLYWRINKSLIKEIFIVSIPLGLATTVGTLNVELDKFIIARFVDAETLAVYTNASKEIPVSLIAGSFTAIMLPQCAKYIKDEAYNKVAKMWGASALISYIFITCLSIGMFVFAKDCIILLYSDTYVSGISIFRVYCLLMMLRSTYFGLVLNSSGKTKEILFSAVVALITNCILNLILYNIIGMIGPAVATLFSQIVMNVMQLYYTKRLILIPIHKIFNYKKVFKTLIINIILGIVFCEVKKRFEMVLVIPSIIQTFILCGAWMCICVIIMRKDIKECWEELK